VRACTVQTVCRALQGRSPYCGWQPAGRALSDLLVDWLLSEGAVGAHAAHPRAVSRVLRTALWLAGAGMSGSAGAASHVVKVSVLRHAIRSWCCARETGCG